MNFIEDASLKRRDFVKTLAAGALALSSPSLYASAGLHQDSDTNEIIKEKVRTAMLTMQRASWEHGVAAQALLESGQDDLVYLMAKEAALRQTAEGRLSVVYTDNGITDPGASGEMVMRMAEKKQDKELALAHEKMIGFLLKKAPRSASGTIYHTQNAPEIWIDSMYMAPPYLCAAGYADECMKQIEGIRSALWNPQAKLYSHRWHDGQKKFINKKFWGVGNGWAAAGLARVIDDLPNTHAAAKNRLIGYATEHIDGCLNRLRADGLFHNVIDDPATFIETNLSQMLAYSIFRGIRSGWLAPSYVPAAEKMREAAYSKIDALGFVQGVCGAPYFDKPGRATEGEAFFLLMESAYGKMKARASYKEHD